MYFVVENIIFAFLQNFLSASNSVKQGRYLTKSNGSIYEIGACCSLQAIYICLFISGYPYQQRLEYRLLIHAREGGHWYEDEMLKEFGM